jgi:hypothetical protein
MRLSESLWNVELEVFVIHAHALQTAATERCFVRDGGDPKTA